ncbi:MAG: hypothetical protein WAW87_09360 [Candidatus Ferrigenium altingense]|jgi:hypothetical protein
MSTNDIQRWETYRGFRIVPGILMQFDSFCTEHSNEWIVPDIVIQPVDNQEPLKTITPEGLYVSTDTEAYDLAISIGKKEIDKLLDTSSRQA